MMTPDLKHDFDARGYVVLRGVVEPSVLRGVQNELARLVNEQARALVSAGKVENNFAAAPFETRLARLYENHNLLFHQGLPNRADTIRWSLDWRYQDATQPTLRAEAGHLARSHAYPDQVVRDAADWAERTFS